jgi:hypothetical protein
MNVQIRVGLKRKLIDFALRDVEALMSILDFLNDPRIENVVPGCSI